MFKLYCVLLGVCITITSTLATSHLRGLDNEVNEALDRAYANTRAILGPEEIQLLEEMLQADELIMERQARGIVDQILQTLSGTGAGSGFGVNSIVGGLGGQNPLTQAMAQVSQIANQNRPSAQAQQPSTSNTRPQADLPAPIRNVINSNTNANAANNATAQGTGNNNPIVNGAGGTDNYLFNQVSKIVLNAGRNNVTGIVDEALKLGTPAPVRELVNGILGVAYCNGIRRLLGRC